MAFSRVYIVLTGACLMLWSFTSLVTPAPVLEDQELTQMVSRVYDQEFSGLQIVVGRGSKVPIENAAAWAVATDCREDFTDKQSLQSRFDRIFKTNFEDRCAEVLPVFSKYKQRIDEIVKDSGQHKEDMLKKMALTCRELVKEGKKGEVYNILLSYIGREKLGSIEDTVYTTSKGGSKRKVCFAGKFEVEFDGDEALEASRDDKSLFSSIAPSGNSETGGYVPIGANEGGKKKKE